jgi:high-affinity iron transporter
MRAVATAAGAVAIAAAAALGAAAPGAGAAVPVPLERITFGTVTCAPSWVPPQPGRDRFAIANQSSRSATVYLFRADSGKIVAQLNHVKSDTVRRLTVRLHPGPYAWGCDLAGYPRHVSEADRVPIHRQAGGSGKLIVPVGTGQLAGPLRAYRRYVARRVAVLRGQVSALRSAIASGSPADARTAWLTAHLTWLTIGQDDGPYGVFGSLGRAIDGTTAGLVGGVRNPRFTGFHRIEWDLWGHGGLAAAGPDAATLARLVGRLTGTSLPNVLPATQLGVTNWTLRCHEVLEDALRDTLSGDDDYGSGTGLVSVTADISATRELLGLLDPLLTPRAPALVGNARRELSRLSTALAAGRRHGDWIAVSALPRSEREVVDAAAGAVLETLSRVPDLLRVGTT